MSARTLIAAIVAGTALAAAIPAQAEIVYGVTTQQVLVSWDSANPTNILSGVALNGFASNERVHSIDFRPATGQLYALGSSSRIYTINLGNGLATGVGGPLSTTLNGGVFGFDFNPMIDRIRVTSDVNQNLVVNPDTGAIQLAATALAYVAGDANFGQDPSVSSSAYTNNFPGAATTQLYGIDTRLDVLVTQANNAGTLNTVGALGLNINSLGGFDISGATTAFATLQPVGESRSGFYSINLATGAATRVGEVGGGLVIEAMALAPSPGSLALALLGFGVAGVRRRR